MPSDENREPERIGEPFAEFPPPGDAEATGDDRDGESDETVRRFRRGDTGLGDPESTAEVVRKLSEEETKHHEEEIASQLQERFDAKLAELADADQGWLLPRGLRTALTWSLVVAGALLGLILISQFAQLIADMARLPAYAQWLAFGGAGLFGAVLVLVIARICVIILKLHRSPRVNIGALAVLDERQQLQQLAISSQREAQESLQRYLQTYPVDRPGTRKLKEAGLNEDEIEAIQEYRGRLLDTNRAMTPGDWLSEFSTGFQKTLDDAAKRRSFQYAKRIGAATAISPMATVDQMIVLYGCSAMIQDLLRIYHLRPALGQTAVLISRGIIHAYLSGMAEEATESVMDSLTGSFGESAGWLGGSFARRVSGKFAEAGLNGVLIWRLGTQARRMLAPTVLR